MKKTVIVNDTSYEFHHGCEIVVENIKELLLLYDIETIDTNPVGKSWNNKKFLQSIAKSDIIIVNGEGTLHHAQPRVKELVSIGKYIKEHFNIPIVLINSTYQDNGDDIADYMRYFDLIYVRETLSKINLAQYSINSSVVPDMTFYTKYVNYTPILKKNIGITDSVFNKLSEDFLNIAINNNYKYLPALTFPKLKINNLINFLKYIKFFILHNIKSTLYFLGYKFDFQFQRQKYYIRDYNSYINEISKLEFFIVGRYHSLCFALKTLTPFVVIKSNSYKIEGLLNDIGLTNNRILNSKDIQKINFKDFVYTKDEEKLIKQFVIDAPKKIEKMFQNIRDLLDK